MLRTAILSEIAVEAGLLTGDSGWVYVVQHQTDAPDLPFEKWAAAADRMSATDARTMVSLFHATTFRCGKCDRIARGEDLGGDRQLTCPACSGMALKRLRTPDVETWRREANADVGDESTIYHGVIVEPVPDGRLYPAEEAVAEPVIDATRVEVVPLIGKLGELNGPRFESELRELITAGVRQIVLDLSRCDSINAAGLTALQRIACELRPGGGRLVMAELSSNVRRMLEMFGAQHEFEFDHSTLGATRRLRKQGLAG